MSGIENSQCDLQFLKYQVQSENSYAHKNAPA